MKRILNFTLLSILVILTSCGKDESDNNSSDAISADIDGVRMTFNTNARAIRTGVGGSAVVQVIGFHGAVGTSEQIAMGLTSALTAVAPGVYTETSATPGLSGAFNYYIPSDFYPYGPNAITTNPCSITVTSISATSIQGTFKGNVYLYDQAGPTTTKKVVTNGQFNVKF